MHVLEDAKCTTAEYGLKEDQLRDVKVNLNRMCEGIRHRHHLLEEERKYERSFSCVTMNWHILIAAFLLIKHVPSQMKLLSCSPIALF